MLSKFFNSHQQELSPFEKQLVKVSWALLVAALLFPTLVRLTVLGVWWTPSFTIFFRAVGMDPMNASGFASIFVLFLGARPSRDSFRVILGLALALEVYYLLFYLPPEMDAFTKIISSGGGFAVAGLLGLTYQAARAGNPSARRRAALMLRISVVLALYPFTSATILGVLSQMTPMVYDSHGYLFEGSLGFHISFETARYLQLNPLAGAFFTAIYSRLPIWVMIAFVLNVFYEKRCYSNLLTAYILSGVFVVGLFFVIPMVGIDYYLGSTYWPLGPLPSTPGAKLFQAGSDLPRSCLPSMHVCWILLPFFCVRRLSPTAAWCYGILVFTTIISAMSAAIGHYFIDFIASVPYALAFQALTAYRTPNNGRWRIIGLTYGLGTTFLYALSLRLAGPSMASHPSLSWGLLLVMLAGSLWIENRLAAVTIADQAQGEPGREPNTENMEASSRES